jgi:hypothetical protein
MEDTMHKTMMSSEFVLKEDGTEICPECGHIWVDYGSGHYHDCRYFTLEDELEEEVMNEEDALRASQISLFRPAA